MNYPVLMALAVFSAFSLNAFVRMDFLWGMNYLYFLPAGFKAVVLSTGFLVFIPSVNQKMGAMLTGIAGHFFGNSESTQHRRLALFLKFAIIIFAVFLCYHFRVYSIYHDSLQGQSVIERDVPIAAYFTGIENMKNKPILLLIIAAVKFLFHETIGLSSYTTLVVFSILSGAFFILLLNYFVLKLNMHPRERLFVFILTATTGISYYFFGYANMYTPIPTLIMCYTAAAILHFQAGLGLWIPLSIGIACLGTSMGLFFIIPSLVALIVIKFRDGLGALYRLMAFRKFHVSIVIMTAVSVVFYILLSLNFVPIRFAQNVFIPPVAGAAGSTLFSVSHLNEVLNAFLLNSPVGFILCLLSLPIIFKFMKDDEEYVFLFWFALGGIVFMLLVNPQGLYAWDIFAWASLPYVIAGALMFARNIRGNAARVSFSTICIVHTLLYFGSWIALNNDLGAAVRNYLRVHPNQITGMLRTIRYHPLKDKSDIEPLLADIEVQCDTKDELIALAEVYLGILDNKNKAAQLAQKAGKLVFDAYKRNTEDVSLYHDLLKMLRLFSSPELGNRPKITTMFHRLIEYEPGNPDYYLEYARYLTAIGDYFSGIIEIGRADSVLRVSSSFPLIGRSIFEQADAIALQIASHVEEYALTANHDSLRIYGTFLMDHLQTYYHGYIILGIYYYSIDKDTAHNYFTRGLELMESMERIQGGNKYAELKNKLKKQFGL